MKASLSLQVTVYHLEEGGGDKEGGGGSAGNAGMNCIKEDLLGKLILSKRKGLRSRVFQSQTIVQTTEK